MAESWLDDYEDCDAVGTWIIKYRFYTTLTGKITKAFFRAMKYIIFLETHLKLRGVNLIY